MALKGAVECLVSSAVVCFSEQTMTMFSFNFHVWEGINTHNQLLHSSRVGARVRASRSLMWFQHSDASCDSLCPQRPWSSSASSSSSSIRPFVSSGKQSWPITVTSQRLMCLWASWWWKLQVNLTDGEAGVGEDVTWSVFPKSRQVREDRRFMCVWIL